MRFATTCMALHFTSLSYNSYCLVGMTVGDGQENNFLGNHLQSLDIYWLGINKPAACDKCFQHIFAILLKC